MECAGIGNLADRTGVRLREQLRGGSGTTGTEDAGAALSHTNLRRRVRLRDDVVGQIAQVEEPARHGVEFHIDQFTRFNHDFPLVAVIDVWLKANQRLTARVLTGGLFFYL